MTGNASPDLALPVTGRRVRHRQRVPRRPDYPRAGFARKVQDWLRPVLGR